jgi:hypothetical protein
MSRRAAGWLAWGLWTVTFGLLALEVPSVNVGDSPLVINIFGSLVLLAYATSGALIAARHPRNAIGWLLLSSALLSALGDVAIEYGVYGLLTRPGAVPGAAWAALVGGELRSVGFFLILTFLLLLFPTGRLPSPHWWTLAWVTVVAIILSCASNAVAADLSSDDTRLTSVASPLALVSAASAVGGLLSLVSLLFIFSCAIGCCAAVVVRFRRARGIERQQLKWLVYAAVWAAVAFFGAWVGVFLSNPILASAITFDLCLLGIPIAVGIAILRHGLFDIDVIINRTLVYGTLTALLAAIYFTGVLGMQSLFNAVTHQPVQQSPAVVVITTLVIAALFNPLRHRIQSFIDHRFYRRKYDAARTLDRFAETLRTDLELTELSGHLLVVAQETMQPAHASLWLRTLDRRQLGPH